MLAFGVQDADGGADQVRRELHQVRVGTVAADDQRDVCGDSK
jgi:hypothetical protein